MNKKNIGYMILFTCIILLSWGCSVYLERFAIANYDGVSVRLEGNGCKQSDIENALNEEREKNENKEAGVKEITAWSRGPRILISNTKLNTSTKTRIIRVFGEMAKVCPLKILYGDFCYQQDTKGCVIDDVTAYELFRDKNVVGNVIVYGEKEYIIRGVVESKEQMILLMSKEKDRTFNNLEIVFGSMENVDRQVENLITNYQLSSDYMTIVEGHFFARLLHNSVILPAIVIWVNLMFRLIRRTWKNRDIPLRCMVYLGMFIIVLLLCLKSIHFYYPDSWIPTRWSDFNFWSRLFSQWKEKLRDFAYLTPLPKDMILKQTFIWCNIMSILTALEILMLIQYQKKPER